MTQRKVPHQARQLLIPGKSSPLLELRTVGPNTGRGSQGTILLVWATNCPRRDILRCLLIKKQLAIHVKHPFF